MELRTELEALQKAEEDIRRADQRIKRQWQLTEELRRDGHDISSALELLDVLNETRSVMVDHRALIVKQIERLHDDRKR